MLVPRGKISVLLIAAMTAFMISCLVVTGMLVVPFPAAADDEPLSARLADNLNISVPSRINYVVKADGTLIAPSADAMYLKNNSNHEVRVSQVSTQASNAHWNIVEDASDTNQQNALSFSISPKVASGDDTNMLAATATIDNTSVNTYSGADVSGGDVSTTTVFNNESSTTPLEEAKPAWTMTAATNDNTGESANTDGSELHFEVNGKAGNINSNQARGIQNVASTKWYVVSDTVTNKVLSYESRIAALEQQVIDLGGVVDGKTNTRVKGDAESSYRTGDVNINYSDIGTVPVANGGTGATTAAGARSNLGAASASDVSNIQSALTVTSGSASSKYLYHSIYYAKYGRIGMVFFYGVSDEMPVQQDTLIANLPASMAPLNSTANFTLKGPEDGAPGIRFNISSTGALTAYLYSPNGNHQNVQSTFAYITAS